MSFRPAGFTVKLPHTLNEEVDGKLLDLFNQLLQDVRLPKIVEDVGGKTWMKVMFRDVLNSLPLEKKLDLIVRGHANLGTLIDRFARLWISQVTGREYLALQKALTDAKLMYTPNYK